VRPVFDALRTAGYRLAICGNQPAHRTAELRALALPAEVIAMSQEMQVAKPSPAYFRRVLELLGDPDPGLVAHVGDRVDNDVLPAVAAGFRSVWLRRGPWGHIQRLPEHAQPTAIIDSLADLPARIEDAFATLPPPPTSV
jgi:FMN phosphatase YigB (HAD superfamily)